MWRPLSGQPVFISRPTFVVSLSQSRSHLIFASASSSFVPSVLLQHVSGKSKNDCFYVIKSITSLILYSPYNTYLLFTSQALVCCLREKNNNFFSYFYFLSLIFLLSSVITTIYYLHDYSQTTQILNIFTYKMVMIISTRCRWED